jgi:hypothetical protein
MDNNGLPVSISVIIAGVIVGILIFAGFIVSAVITGSLVK